MKPDQAASLLGFDSVDEMYEAIRQELISAGASMQGLTPEQRDLVKRAKEAGLNIQAARDMAGVEGVAFNQKVSDVYLSAAPSIAPNQRSAAPSFIGTPRTLTYFSGGGLVEEGLRGIINPVAAVEFDPDIAAAYKDAHGDHITIDDINNVDPSSFGIIEYFHASPVCKNSSLLKSKKRGGGEGVCDIAAAKSTAKVIRESSPKVVTIENVSAYAKTEAAQIKRAALIDGG